jgi:acetolactate synthase-1/3 small subunit
MTMDKKNKYTISAFVQNSPGILNRVTIVFTRRKINIDSLTVSETEKKGISRFTIVVTCTEKMVERLQKQINKVIEVYKVFVCEDDDIIFNEIAFFKMQIKNKGANAHLERIAGNHRAKVVHATPKYMVIEKTGSVEEITSLFHILEPYNILEFIQSGRIAILKNEEGMSDFLPEGVI